MATLTKQFRIEIELDEANRKLVEAGKLLQELKEKTRAANQEEKDAKAVYRENVAALKELEKAQKALQRAREEASGRGADFFKANAALEKNIKQQAELNFEIDQSRTYYEQARASAKGAGDQQMQQTALVKQAAAAVKDAAAAEKARAQAAKEAMREAVAAEKARVQAAKTGGTGSAPASGAAVPTAPGAPAVAPDILKRLRDEVAQLTRAWALTTEGTKEFDAALLRVAEKKAELAKLEERLKGLDPRKQVEAFTQFSNGVAGAFAVCTVAAESFGFSQTAVEQYEKKLLGFISVMHGVEAVSRAVNGSNLAVVKTSLSAAKAWLFAGEAASTSAKVTRAALISTGLGLFIVLIGTLVANWENVKASFKGSEAIFTKLGAVFIGVFSGMIAYVKETGKLLVGFFTGDVVGMVEDARNFGKNVGKAYQEGYRESIADAHRERLQLQIEANERLIAEGKAAGKNMKALEEQTQALRVSAIKRGTKEGEKAYLDAKSAQKQLRAANQKEELQEVDAFLNAVAQADIARRQALGEQTLGIQLVQKERELEQLLQSEDRTAEAVATKTGEIETLRAAIVKDAADKAQALQLARLNAQAVIEQAKGKEAFAQQLAVKEAELQQLNAATQRNGAAILAKEAEIQALRITAKRAADKKAADVSLATLQSELAALQAQGYEALDKQIEIKNTELRTIEQIEGKGSAAAIAKKGEINALLLAAEKAGADGRMEVREQERSDELGFQDTMKASIGEGMQELVDRSKQVPTLGGIILEKVFGVAPADVEKTKAAFNDAFSKVVEAGQILNDAFFASALDRTQELIERYSKAMDAARDRSTLAQKELQEAAQERRSLEQQLDNATGSRREYLIQQIARRRQEEAKAAREKKAADAEELRNAKLKEEQEKKRQKLERESQILMAATATAANAATAAEAVRAGVLAVVGANKQPWPLNLAALLSGLAATAAAIGSAKQLGNTLGKRERGGLVHGPSHMLGGIRYGSHEIEGLEFVTSRKATANNLKTLEQINQYGDRIEFIAVPRQQVGRAANGGQLQPDGSVAGGVGQGMVAVPAEQLQSMVELLSQIAGHTGTTAGYGPAVMDFGPQNSRRIMQNAKQEEQDANAGRLFG